MDAPHVDCGPAFWLEWLVEKTTPQRDRDGIVGDLREIYRSDRQYLAEALRTVPRVVFGRACAQADVPSLCLQLSVIFLFAGPWGVFCALPLLALAEAYRPSQQPETRRIVLQAAFVSAAAFIILGLSSLQTLTVWHVGADPDKTLALYLLLLCPLIPPVVCGLSVLFMDFAAPRSGGAPWLVTRQQLFWLLCAAAMVALHEQVVKAGLLDVRPMLVQLGYVGAGILFFLGLAFSRSCAAPSLPNFMPR